MERQHTTNRPSVGQIPQLLRPPDPTFDTDGSDVDGLSTPQDNERYSQSQGQRPRSSAGATPVLFHKVKDTRSILSLIVSESQIFAGTQGGEILVCSTLAMLANVAYSSIGVVASNLPGNQPLRCP